MGLENNGERDILPGPEAARPSESAGLAVPPRDPDAELCPRIRKTCGKRARKSAWTTRHVPSSKSWFAEACCDTNEAQPRRH